MKILVLKQGIKDQATLDKGLSLAKQLCSTIGLNLDFTQFETTKQFTAISSSTTNTSAQGFTLNSEGMFQEAKTKNIPFDVVLLVYDWSKIPPYDWSSLKPIMPSEYGLSLSIATQWYATFPNVFAEFLLHEICHYYAQLMGKSDYTHMKYDPMWKDAFSQKSNETYYLYLLKDFVNSIKPIGLTYKYFSQKEVEKNKLVPKLWEMLDKAREISGIPYIINSGRRSISTNEDVGGVMDSSHLNGLGCDIRALNSTQHYLITKGLYSAGFRRISRKYPTHIHCDIDLDKSQDVLF